MPDNNIATVENSALLVCDKDARLALWALVIIESIRLLVEVVKNGLL